MPTLFNSDGTPLKSVGKPALGLSILSTLWHIDGLYLETQIVSTEVADIAVFHTLGKEFSLSEQK